jgi:hypothetical protein
MIKIGGSIPPSLSASVFNIPTNKRWIWTVVLFVVCFLCVTTYIEKTSGNTQFLAFIAIAALAFVGAAPLVKDKADIAHKVHCGAAVLCAVCSQLPLTFNCPWLLLCWLPFLAALSIKTDVFKTKWETMIFWAEMVCFGSTFVFCLI